MADAWLTPWPSFPLPSPAGGPLPCQSGVFAAFGLARGLALFEDSVAMGGPEGGLAAWAGGAVEVGESVLIFAFAAAALELAGRFGFVRKFSSADPNDG